MNKDKNINGPPGPCAINALLSSKLHKKRWVNDEPKALDISDVQTVKHENVNYIKIDRNIL